MRRHVSAGFVVVTSRRPGDAKLVEKGGSRAGSLSEQLCERPNRDADFSFFPSPARKGIEFEGTSVTVPRRGCTAREKREGFRSVLFICRVLRAFDIPRNV